MNAPNFGNICEDPQDGILANRLAIWMAKIEEAMTGANLKRTLQDCETTEYLSPEEIRKREKKAEEIEKNLYATHNSHTIQLIIFIVDDLSKITVEIDRIQMVDVKLFLRSYYYQIKSTICQNAEAQAYYLNKQ
jgi:hypothetical protein